VEQTRELLLDVRGLEAGYLKRQVLYNISLKIQPGEIVSLIGHNGAGKSTALRSIFGLVLPSRGQVLYMSREVTLASPAEKLGMGICHMPQENFIFSDQTIRENLEMAYFTENDLSRFESKVKDVYQLFPVLGRREGQLAGTLSGGERRMLGIGMGLLRQPKLFLIDEPSSGLSPIMFQNVIQVIQKINNLGTAILLVEQNVRVAFKISQRVYVMKAGSIILEETGKRLLERSEWWDLF
jgi:branched-chain amino acid transport system ATP-binding protein